MCEIFSVAKDKRESRGEEDSQRWVLLGRGIGSTKRYLAALQIFEWLESVRNEHLQLNVANSLA